MTMTTRWVSPGQERPQGVTPVLSINHESDWGSRPGRSDPTPSYIRCVEPECSLRHLRSSKFIPPILTLGPRCEFHRLYVPPNTARPTCDRRHLQSLHPSTHPDLSPSGSHRRSPDPIGTGPGYQDETQSTVPLEGSRTRFDVTLLFRPTP